jgi:hypothetical protein
MQAETQEAIEREREQAAGLAGAQSQLNSVEGQQIHVDGIRLGREAAGRAGCVPFHTVHTAGLPKRRARPPLTNLSNSSN